MNKRNKYDYKFRLRCVEAVLKKGLSKSQASRENGVERSNLRLWILFYERYGKEGLKPRSKRQYDTTFKREVLSTIDKEHLSLKEACVRFNIPSDSVIISWRKAFEGNGPGLIYKPKGRPIKMDKPIKREPRKSDRPSTREEELLKENEFLKAENALLKKLHALIQTVQKRKP